MKPVRGKEEGGSGLSPLIKIDQSPSHGLLGLAFLRPEAAFHNNADMTDISVRKKSAAWGKILDKKTKFCQISLKLDLPQNIRSYPMCNLLKSIIIISSPEESSILG